LVLFSDASGTTPNGRVGINSFYDGAFKPLIGAHGAWLTTLEADGPYRIENAPAVAAGAVQTFTTRLTLDQAGNLGVGVNPAAQDATNVALQVGAAASFSGTTAATTLRLASNNRISGGGNVALVTGASSVLVMDGQNVGLYSAPSVAAGAPQTMAARLAVGATGTLTLTPDAGAQAMAITSPNVASQSYGIIITAGTNAGDNALAVRKADASRYTAVLNGAGTLTLTPDAGADALTIGTVNASINCTAGALLFKTAGNAVAPYPDGTYMSGTAGNRWNTVFSVVGTINTSSQEFKEGITPLSPAECYQAAKDVRWYEYAYRPPVYTPPEPPPDIAYDAADDNETKAEKKAARDEAEAASKAAHLKMVAETAPARHQRGFVFPAGASAKDELGGALPPVPDLFGLSDRQSTTPQADLATLGCALQEVIRRLEQLEAPAA